MTTHPAHLWIRVDAAACNICPSSMMFAAVCTHMYALVAGQLVEIDGKWGSARSVS